MFGLFQPLAASSSSSSSGGLSLVIFLVVIVASFYFLLIRPQQRRTRQQRSLLESVAVGDEVLTIGGIYGTVRAMDDESFTIEVAPQIDLRISRSAVARKVVYQDVDEEEDDTQDHEEAGGQA